MDTAIIVDYQSNIDIRVCNHKLQYVLDVSQLYAYAGNQLGTFNDSAVLKQTMIQWSTCFTACFSM